jgi:hypothetical protein
MMSPKVKHLLLLPMLLVLPGIALSQSTDRSLYFWRFHSISGEARVYGLYREQERVGLDFYEYQKSSYVSGGIFLKTNSSILSKNFLDLNIDLGYMPETSQDNFITVPDQAEVRTMKKLGVNASFLKQKKLNFNVYGNYDESYSSRENLTDLKSKNWNWGGALIYNNNFLPLTFDFNARKWEEVEIQTERKYTMDQKTFGVRTYKSFTKLDRNELKYSHDENVSVNQNLYRVENTIDNIEFSSLISLDEKRKYNLNTLISSFNQYGNTNLKRFQANENLNFLLPLNLSFFANYSFFNTLQDLSDLKQNSINTSLQHKLYESLISKINFEYNDQNHSAYHEFNYKYGIEFNYSKKIYSGQLLINYRFDRYHQDYNSESFALHVTSEVYTLSDNELNLLKVPYVNPKSLVVKDISSSIIYLEGFDYILIEVNNYIEIRRVPGGAIPKNSTVLIDYLATQPGDYKYDTNTHVLTSNVFLLKNLLSLNYRFSTQDYSNLKTTDLVTLNYFTQNLIGCRLDFGFINAGAEYEDYKSSILPYKMLRYYANFQKSYKEKVIFMINGNKQDYVMLDGPEPNHQKYTDITGKIVYSLMKHTSLNIDMMYRKQIGRGIELDLLTGKTELISSINLLFITLGMEVYKRNYVGEQINFKGAYLRISRKF